MKNFIKNLDWLTVAAAAFILVLLSPLVIAEEPKGEPVNQMVVVAVVCTAPGLFADVLLEADEVEQSRIAIKQVEDGLCQPLREIQVAQAVEKMSTFYRVADGVLFTVYKLDPARYYHGEDKKPIYTVVGEPVTGS